MAGMHVLQEQIHASCGEPSEIPQPGPELTAVVSLIWVLSILLEADQFELKLQRVRPKAKRIKAP